MMGHQRPVRCCCFLLFVTAAVCLGQMVSFVSAASPISEAEREKQEAEVGGCTQAILIGVEIDHMTGKEAIEYVKASQTK